MSNDNLAMGASVEELNKALETIKAVPQTEAQEPVEVKEAVEASDGPAEVEPKVEDQPEAQETAPAEEAKEQPAPGMDYKKQYEALRPWMTRLSQDVANMKRAPVAERQEQPSPEATSDQWQQAYENDPLGTMQVLSQKVAEQNDAKLQDELNRMKQTLGGVLAESSISRARSKHEDFSDFEGEITESVNNLPPGVIQNPLSFDRVLEEGYWAAKGRKLSQDASQAKEVEQQRVVTKRRAKAEAHVEGSAKTSAEQSLDYSHMSSDELFKVMQSRGMISE